jgi:hypothetical protein
MRIFSISGVLLSLLVSLSWNPPIQFGQDVKPTIPAVSKAAIKKTEDAMQGVWRLTDFVAPRLTLERRTDVGYCLVQGKYLSLEVHVGWLSEDGKSYEHKDFQTGMYRFELDQTGRMETLTVIGTQMAAGRVPTAEVPNTKRGFKITALLDNMTWRGDDGTQFVFERMLDTRGKRDVYGRLIPDKKATSGQPKDVTGGSQREDGGTPPEEKPDDKDGKPPEEKTDGGGGRMK